MTRRNPLLGQVRAGQLLHVYGVGAIVDLPKISAMVMGLDEWDESRSAEIAEPRLLAAVQGQLGPAVRRLRSAPLPPEEQRLFRATDDESAQVGVPVAVFPRYMRCPWCGYLGPLDSGLFSLVPDPYRPERTRYVHTNCQVARRSAEVVPARFLLACDAGHLDDFPWLEFVHRGPSSCTGPLKMTEEGVGGEAADVRILCTACKAARPMVEAFGEEGAKALPPCRARRPHLRDFDPSGCTRPVRPMLLGASNSWFPISLSVLSLPTSHETLPQLVEDSWRILSDVSDRAILAFLRKRDQLGPLARYGDDEIWGAIEMRRTGQPAEPPADLRWPEWSLFARPDKAPTSPDFRLRRLAPPPAFAKEIEFVVAAERLREVTALVGFTRIDPPGDYAGVEEIPRAMRAPLAREVPPFVPASEVRGEGIFIRFREERIAAWSRRVADRAEAFTKAHAAWRRQRAIEPPEAGFPGMRFLLVHSFAHALMRQLALECGYSAASLKERVYARDAGEEEPMAGVLLYTAAADAEGTLGGLVALAEPGRLGRHIARALAQMQLCSSDPLCAEHLPFQEEPTLHGAACHACLFAPETSCERGNRYLDRTLLVPTVAQHGFAFFAGGG